MWSLRVACAAPPPLTSPQHQFCILWIVIAAILIAATAAAEKANGPDSNYETGLMSVILIGLTAVPAVLTLFWVGKWMWDKRAWCVRDAGGGGEDAMQEEAAVETEAAGTEDGQEGVGLSSDEEKAGSVEKETVDHKANKRLEEENKELKAGVSELTAEIAALKAENAAQAETIAAEALREMPQFPEKDKPGLESRLMENKAAYVGRCLLLLLRSIAVAPAAATHPCPATTTAPYYYQLIHLPF